MYTVQCTVYVLWFLKTENITFFILDANKIIWQARNKFRAGREKNFSAGNEETFLPNTLEYTQELARKMFRENFLPGNFAKANVSMFVTCWQRKIKILANIFVKIIFICFAPRNPRRSSSHSLSHRAGKAKWCYTVYGLTGSSLTSGRVKTVN